MIFFHSDYSRLSSQLFIPLEDLTSKRGNMQTAVQSLKNGGSLIIQKAINSLDLFKCLFSLSHFSTDQKKHLILILSCSLIRFIKLNSATHSRFITVTEICFS